MLQIFGGRFIPTQCCFRPWTHRSGGCWRHFWMKNFVVFHFWFVMPCPAQTIQVSKISILFVSPGQHGSTLGTTSQIQPLYSAKAFIQFMPNCAIVNFLNKAMLLSKPSFRILLDWCVCHIAPDSPSVRSRSNAPDKCSQHLHCWIPFNVAPTVLYHKEMSQACFATICKNMR